MQLCVSLPHLWLRLAPKISLQGGNEVSRSYRRVFGQSAPSEMEMRGGDVFHVLWSSTDLCLHGRFQFCFLPWIREGMHRARCCHENLIKKPLSVWKEKFFHEVSCPLSAGFVAMSHYTRSDPPSWFCLWR